MVIKVMTLFPEMFLGPFNSSIIQRAKERNIIDLEYINIRNYADNKHKKWMIIHMAGALEWL